MSPVERPWLRLYSETIHDRKLRGLKPEQRWLWIALLCMAGASKERGTLLVGLSIATVADIADEAALPPAKVKTGLGELELRGMIEQFEGAWRISNWTDRQFEQPNPSTRRVQLFRDPHLRQEIRDRDGDLCRYCGLPVDWKDRRGPGGGTYDHVEPDGATDLANLVVSCRSCNGRKGRRSPTEANMPLLPPGFRTDLDRDLALSESPESESEDRGNSVSQQSHDAHLRPVENPDDEKLKSVLDQVANAKLNRRPPGTVRDPARYRASCLLELQPRTDELRSVITSHPEAPIDVLAGWVLGEPNTLGQYRQNGIA